MELADIEHSLCEVDKYSRVKHPTVKAKRNKIRRTFKPSDRDYSPLPAFPKAWEHPAREIIRIRSSPPILEKRYQISRLGGYRMAGGVLEFEVFWVGYPDSDATWEPQEILQSDAPAVLVDYIQNHDQLTSFLI